MTLSPIPLLGGTAFDRVDHRGGKPLKLIASVRKKIMTALNKLRKVKPQASYQNRAYTNGGTEEEV